ncbi:MAG TPA: protein translocase subunit SecD [Desulfatiglandales bacterium]|nr:protein translocase subunit SecD [Desulfatiglandales bacterium]
MKRLGWRAGIAAALIVIAFVFLVPSMTQDLPAWWSGVLPKDKIHLGLDLQGGVHLILEVQVKKAVESYLERVVEDLKPDLRKSKIRGIDLKRRGIEGIELTVAPDQEAKDLETLVATNYPSLKLETGVRDEKGKTYFLSLNEQERTQIYKMAADQALETIRNRVDQFGVTEPDIRPQTGYRILIQLPGVKDPKRAIDLIGKTARLEFKLVDEENSLEDALKGNVPAGSEILQETAVDRKTGRKTTVPYLLKKRSPLTGESITDARVELERMGEPYVSLSFDSRGARVFERITGDNVGKRLAIVLDDKVYSAPVIRDKISGGKAQITGAFSMDDAKDLAIVLRAGALPAPVKILEERTVGPSLGKDSIDQGFTSMVIGLSIILILVAIYYRLSGIIADVVLLLNIPFILGGLALFGATLTLPGIAGVILSIAMSVDANVLIYERIREELRLGKPARAAMEAGFARAFVTIFDSNLTTVIAGLVLLQFGTGPVRGFAVTLIIGLVSNVLTAVFMARIVFDYLYVIKRWKTISI